MVYSSAKGGARKRIIAPNRRSPKTGNKSPPKSLMLEATMLEEAATLEEEKSATFSIMLTFGASRPTKAGEETVARRKYKESAKKERVDRKNATVAINAPHLKP
jgi:hypothetical protein